MGQLCKMSLDYSAHLTCTLDHFNKHPPGRGVGGYFCGSTSKATRCPCLQLNLDHNVDCFLVEVVNYAGILELQLLNDLWWFLALFNGPLNMILVLSF